MAQQGKGVQVGNKIRVSFVKSGTKQDGSMWQLFTYQESKKNPQTGEYDRIGTYTIFVNNPNNNIKNNDYVTIKSITKILSEVKYVNNKAFNNFNAWCDVELNAPYTPQFIDNQQPQYNQQNYNEQMNVPTFSGVDDNDLPF